MGQFVLVCAHEIGRGISSSAYVAARGPLRRSSYRPRPGDWLGWPFGIVSDCTMWKRVGLLPCLLALAACGPESPLGFSLPDGDAARGQEAFVALRCNSCHEVEGLEIAYREGLARVTLG